MLYSLVNSAVVNYNDTYCTQLGFSFRASSDSSNTILTQEESDLLNQLITNEQFTKTKFRKIAEYNLYPNPATNLVYINSSNAAEKINLIITDVTGKNFSTKKHHYYKLPMPVKFKFIKWNLFCKFNK